MIDLVSQAGALPAATVIDLRRRAYPRKRLEIACERRWVALLSSASNPALARLDAWMSGWARYSRGERKAHRE